MCKKKRSEEKNNYIRALIYGDEKVTFYYPDLVEHLGIKMKSGEEVILRDQIAERNIFYLDPLNSTTNFINSCNERDITTRLSLSVEDKFRLLEYTELKEARASSHSATMWAVRAFVISIISTVFAIVIGICQMVKG